MLTLKQPDEFQGSNPEGREVAHASFDMQNALKGTETKQEPLFIHDLRLEHAGVVAWPRPAPPRNHPHQESHLRSGHPL